VFFALFFSAIMFFCLVKISPPMRTRISKTIARLESYSNNVRYKEVGSVSFYDVIKNEDFQNKDEIFTGENSIAVVRFLNSNTILKIPSSSLIKVEDGDNGESIDKT
jgi:hypothetical protein